MFDVFSINIYSDRFAPDAQTICEYAQASRRPVLIGEFTAAASGRGLQGLFYFVHKVRDQQEREGVPVLRRELRCQSEHRWHSLVPDGR